MKYILIITGIAALSFMASTSSAQSVFKRDNAEEYYRQAATAIKADDNQKAITLLKKALTLRKDYVDAKVLLSKAYLQNGEYGASLVMGAEAIKQSPNYRDPYVYVINVYVTKRKDRSALYYVNAALQQFPDDREFIIKKINILDLLHQYPQSDELVEDLYKKNNNAADIRALYVGHYQEEGNYYNRAGNTSLAKVNFEKVLIADPNSTGVLNSLTNLDIKNDDYQSSLNRINRSLEVNPSSYSLLMRKLGVLQESKKYAEAIDLLGTIRKYYPNDPKVIRLDSELRLEAAKFYENTSSYEIYQSMLYKNPNDQVALNKVISAAMARGADREALYYVNQALKKNPNNASLLQKKLDLEEYGHNYVDAALIAEDLNRRSTKLVDNKRLEDLKAASGKYYLGQQQPDMALKDFDTALGINPMDLDAIQGKLAAYGMQHDTAASIQTINYALARYPDNKDFMIRKSAILAEAGQQEEAAAISGGLLNTSPEDKRISSMYADQNLTIAAQDMKDEEYEEARPYLQSILKSNPKNRIALNYLINSYSATKNYNRALAVSDSALAVYPNNKEFMLKKSSILYDMGNYKESANVSKSLYDRYPYNNKYRTTYTDALVLNAKSYEKTKFPDSALMVYRQVLTIAPGDSLASIYSSNILIERKKYDSALVIVDSALLKRPEAGSFLYRRALILEQKKEYTAAAMVSDSLQKLYPTKANIDYNDYLKGKSYKNQFGLYFLHSSYESLSGTANPPSYGIATVEYRHFFKRGSYAARFNFAGRENGTGVSGEGELYYNHSTTLYSYANIGISNDIVLPRYRLAYSAFKTFKHDWEVELGLRYLQIDSIRSTAIVASVAKTWGDFWVNLRGYGIRENGNNYGALNLTSRYYMNNRQEFLSIVGGLGTSPDDRSRLIAFPQLVGLLSRDIGVGYQKIFRYRTTVGINATWINEKITPQTFQNQYDIYLTLQRKF